MLSAFDMDEPKPVAFLTNKDVVELIDLRRALHREPELSGQEVETARKVRRFLAASGPDRIVSDLGGHGVAAVYEGAATGPTVMFRSELDALPIQETSDVGHRSVFPGKGHLCGHDGHMATVAALARGLGRARPARGRAVLLFQPAEEDGSGAAAVLADGRFADIAPDYAFALHNMPGIPLGRAALTAGPMNCASQGLRITLTGRTAHASMPEQGVSPMRAAAKLSLALLGLRSGRHQDAAFAMATVAHVKIGEPAFGISPGYAELWVTLRTLTDARMEELAVAAEALARGAAARAKLRVEISHHDVFLHCANDADATAHLRRALDAENVPHDAGDLPMRASEDFGRFGRSARAAMFLLGAGENHPSLHNPDFDYPDALIAIGAGVFMRTLRGLLG